MILDGWGKSKNPKNSAIDNANTQFIDSLYEKYPNANLKTDGLNNSNHWGFLSIVPSGNNINVYTNVGRTDGDTSKGDIKECSATVID